MSFVTGINIDTEYTATNNLDYQTFPTLTKQTETLNALNQIISSLAVQNSGNGSFMIKSIDGVLKANLESPTFTGTVAGITKSMVGLSNVDNTTDVLKPISTAQQTALDLKAPINNPTFTGTVAGITKAMVGLTNAQNTTDALKPISTATQTALDLKAPINNPTFTGTVVGITKSMVGLSNVNDTTDVLKPISTAQQTALDLKANLSGATFSGGVFFTSNTPSCSIQPTINSHLANKRYIDENCLLLNGNQTMTGTKTFNNIVITGTQTETGNMIIGDATTDTLTINSTTVVNSVSLTPTQLSNIKWLDNVSSNVQPQIDAKTTLSAVQSNNNTFLGSNSFNTSLPTSALTPSTDTQLTTKSYVDTQISNLVNSSPDNLNTLNELSLAIGADANFSTTMTNLIGTKAGLTSNNSMTGINTFTSLPVTSTDLVPTDNKHVTPKKWCDDTFVKLGSNNTLTGVQNFNNNVVIGDGVGSDLMTINCNISTNSNIVTPSNLARVRFLSNITSDVQTNINSKASLTSANTFTNTNTFNNLPLIGSDLTPSDDKNLIPLKYANDTYSKLASDNIYSGTQNFNSNVVMGDDVSDTLTLNSTLVSNSVSITPTQLSKVQHLSSVSSNVQDQIDAKTSLSNVLSSSNTFANQNIFSGVTIFNNDVSARDVFLPSGSTNRTIQWTNSTNFNNIGIIEGDISGEFLKIKSKNDLQFLNPNDQVVAKINKNGTPTADKDIVLVETMESRFLLEAQNSRLYPTAYYIGNAFVSNSIEDTLPSLTIYNGFSYIKFKTLKHRVNTCFFDINYHISRSPPSTNTDPYVTYESNSIWRTAKYLVTFFYNRATQTWVASTLVKLLSGSNLHSNYSFEGYLINMIQFGLTGGQPSVRVGFPTQYTNLQTNNSFISSYGCSIDIQTSPPDSMYANYLKSNNEAGLAYFSLTA